VEGQLAVARTDIERAFGGLAGALGLPLDTARAIELSFEELEALPEAPAPQDIQRDALLNRLDMRRRLLEYAAADSAVKLEVLRQYPTLTLRPGYLWDQGDSVWILGANLLLPPTLGNAPAIKQAEAQREAAAEVALQQQAAILAEGQAALATYRQSAIGYRSAQAASHMQLARSSQAQKQFDAGYVDRLDLSLSRLEMIVVDRNAYIARIEAERALGRLEDAVQRPLVGDPLPAFAAPVKQP
jgi:outer membrane protein TolC